MFVANNNRMFVSGLAVGILGNAGFFRGGQLVALPKIQGLPAPHPFAISADGRTVIGQFAPGNPFVWKGRSIVQFKPFKDVFAHFVQGVSADGSTIVGKANAGFIWKLGKSKSLPKKGTFCVGVSGDGRVVVGQEEWQEPLGSEGSVTNQRLKARGLRRGFIWKGDSIEVIPEFAPLCISLDGKVIAGVHTEGEKTSAYVRSGKQVTALPVPTETSDSVAYAINRDGARTVGCVTLESGSTQGICGKDRTNLCFCKIEGQALRWQKQLLRMVRGLEASQETTQQFGKVMERFDLLPRCFRVQKLPLQDGSLKVSMG